MNSKKRLIIILCAIIAIGCLVLTACTDGDDPVESIAVTREPVKTYYRGDVFNLDGAAITVYYQSGKVETIPLEESMLSDFDPQSVGDQILTVTYGGAQAYIRVSVQMAPVYSIAVAPGNYKTSYVEGEAMDISNLYIIVTYTNNYTEQIAVTEDMVSGFDSGTVGDREMTIRYGDVETRLSYVVLATAIARVELVYPDADARNYIVGQEVDFTGCILFVSYNNSRRYQYDPASLRDDPNFHVYIGAVNGERTETYVFTQRGNMTVTLSYYGFEVSFPARVEENEPVGYTWEEQLAAQPQNSLYVPDKNTPDLRTGAVRFRFRDDSEEVVRLSDPRISYDKEYGAYDNSTIGTYNIRFWFRYSETDSPMRVDCEVQVVAAIPEELEILLGDNIYYQGGEQIDVTDWKYKIRLTNGAYSTFADQSTEWGVSEDMLVGNPSDYDFSTDEPGERIFEFAVNQSGVALRTTVTVTVAEKIIVGTRVFNVPDRTIYFVGDELDFAGGNFIPLYNDGTEGERRELSDEKVIFAEETDRTLLTATEGGKTVRLTYTDEIYGGTISLEFDITVVRRAESIAFDAVVSASGMKSEYILGETFDPTNLYVSITYAGVNSSSLVNTFDGVEWTFVYVDGADNFDRTGETVIYLRYGDAKVEGAYVQTEIPVKVTNYVTGIKMDDSFTGFPAIPEGTEIVIPDTAVLVVTRQNGATERVKVIAAMLDFDSRDPNFFTPGTKDVTLRYDGDNGENDKYGTNAKDGMFVLVLEDSLEVTVQRIVNVEFRNYPDKVNYIRSDLESDYYYDLSGLELNITYDNNIQVHLFAGDLVPTASSDGFVYSYTFGNDYRAEDIVINFVFSKLRTLEEGETFSAQNVTLRVYDASDETNYRESAYELVLYKQLIEGIEFGIDTSDGNTDSKTYHNQTLVVNAFETTAATLKFPENAYVTVKYVGDEDADDKIAINSLNYSATAATGDEYSLSDFKPNKSGLQVIKFNYLRNSCSVNVFVQDPALAERENSLHLDKTELDMVRGVALGSDKLKATINMANGRAQDVDLRDLTTNYNPRKTKDGAEYSFNEPAASERKIGYYTDDYVFSYTYVRQYFDFTIGKPATESVELSAGIRIRTLRESAVRIQIERMPETVYIEGSAVEDFNYDTGRIKVFYNNGDERIFNMTNSAVEVVVEGGLKDDELYNGGEAQYTVSVTFTDDNRETAPAITYAITVRDRQYLTVTFDNEPSGGVFSFIYGAESKRITGTIKYFGVDTLGESVENTVYFSAAKDDPDLNGVEFLGYDELRKGEGGVFLPDPGKYYMFYSYMETYGDAWAKQCGTYTMYILYGGDKYNNAATVTKQIVINEKELSLTATSEELTYGMTCDGSDPEDFIENIFNFGAVAIGPEGYEPDLPYLDDKDEIVAPKFEILDFRGLVLDWNNVFYFNNGRAVLILGAGEYTLRLSDDTALTGSEVSNNYTISEKREINFTIAKKEIRIEAIDCGKIYGNSDPRMNRYKAYEKVGDVWTEITDLDLEANTGYGYFILDKGGAEYRDDVTNYALIRVTGENVGEYQINKGIDNYLPNYAISEDEGGYKSATFTIEKREITVMAWQTESSGRPFGRNPDVGKEYSFEMAEGSTMGYADVFSTVFADLLNYAESDNIKVTIVKEGTPDDLGYKELPNDAHVGKYTVSFEYVEPLTNYDVTIESLTYIINPRETEVRVESDRYVYGDINGGADYNAKYTLSVGEDYALDIAEQLKELAFTRETGVGADVFENVGRYAVSISEASKAKFTDYTLVLKGDYGEFLTELLDPEEIELTTEENESAYVLILPAEAELSMDATDVYSHKLLTAEPPAISAKRNGEVADVDETAFDFDFAAEAGVITYFYAGTYTLTLTYNYFHSDASMNYIPTLLNGMVNEDATPYSGVAFEPKSMYKYLAFGKREEDKFENDDVVFGNITYIVNKKEIKYELYNEDVAYSGEEITISDNLAAIRENDICEADDPTTFVITTYIEVKYNTGEEEAAESTTRIMDAGTYRIAYSGISNVNYTLSADSSIEERIDRLDWPAEGEERKEFFFTVSPADLKIMMTRADENGFVTRDYDSNASKKPISDTWSKKDGGYSTVSHTLVDNVLDVNPRGLSIIPEFTDANGDPALPTNVAPLDNVPGKTYTFAPTGGNPIEIGVYRITWSVASRTKNYNIKFVDGGGAETEYYYVITPHRVTVRGLSELNHKIYDGQPANIVNRSALSLSGYYRNTDQVTGADLTFEFTRDETDKISGDAGEFVPGAEDLTSAGTFDMTARSTRTNNYYFDLSGITKYYIYRSNAQITLNGIGALAKDYDTFAPTVSFAGTGSGSAITFDISAQGYNGFLRNPTFDKAYIDLEFKSYRSSSGSWSAVSADNAVGEYAYNIKPYLLLDGGAKLYLTGMTDNINDGLAGNPNDNNTYRGNKLLSWNYTYTIRATSSANGETVDGIFTVNQKDILLRFEGENVSNTVLNGNTYTAYKTYNRLEVTQDDALGILKANFKVTDAEGNDLNEDLSKVLVKSGEDLSLVGGASITNAGSNFVVNIDRFVGANPNFRVVDSEIIFEIARLTVEVTVNFTYEGANHMIYGSDLFGKDEPNGFGNHVQIEFRNREKFFTDINVKEGDPDYDKIYFKNWVDNYQSDFNVYYARFALYGGANFDEYIPLDAGTSSRIIPVGNYHIGFQRNAGLEGEYSEIGIQSNNYDFVIYYGSAEEGNVADFIFSVTRLPIKVLSATRDYFDKNSIKLLLAPYDIVDETVEQTMIERITALFINSHNRNYTAPGAAVEANIGTGGAGDNRYALTLEMDTFENQMRSFPNYDVTFDNLVTDEGQRTIKIGLEILPIELHVGMKGASTPELEMEYGDAVVLTTANVDVQGLPALSSDQGYSLDQYQRRWEQIRNTFADGTDASIFDTAKLEQALAGMNAYDPDNNSAPENEITYVDLSEYIKNPAEGNDIYSNFKVIIGSLAAKISQKTIRLQITPSKPVGANNQFGLVFDELDKIAYSNVQERWNYSISVINPEDIRGRAPSVNDIDSLFKLLEIDKKYLRTEVRNASDANDLHAGPCVITLRDYWYDESHLNHHNYRIVCEVGEDPNLLLYPKIVSMGENDDNEMPYAELSLSGSSSESLRDRLATFSMLVHVDYVGLSPEWLDTARMPNSTLYANSNYLRNWNIELYEPDGTTKYDMSQTVVSGQIIQARMTLTQSFFNNDGTYEVQPITSGMFFIKICAGEDEMVADKNNFSFVYNGTQTSDFGATKESNFSYYATNGKTSTEKYSGLYDMVGADFVLQRNNAEGSYLFELILFETDKARLVLGFRGGANYGYYVRLEALNGEFETREETLTTYNTEQGGQRSVLQDVNMFDGQMHRVSAYIDKIGRVNWAGAPLYSQDAQDDGTALGTYSRTMDRYYNVTFIIDDKFVYSIDYLGGAVTQTSNSADGSDPIYSFAYDADFFNESGAAKGYVGFRINETKVNFTRFTLMNIGVGLITDESRYYVADLRVRPVETGVGYTPVVYFEQTDGAANDVREFIEVYALNAKHSYRDEINPGYGGEVDVSVNARNAVNQGTSAPVGWENRPGVYLVEISIRVGSMTLPNTTRFYVGVIDGRDQLATLAKDGATYAPYPDNPVTIDDSGSGLYASPQIVGGIEYSRYVFDLDLPNVGSSVNIVTRATSPNYIGIASMNQNEYAGYRGFEIGVRKTGESTYSTFLGMRAGEIYRSYSVTENISWEGNGNILEVRYDEGNGVIYITLTRDGTTLYRTNIKSQDSWLRDGASRPLSRDDIRSVLGYGVEDKVEYTVIGLNDSTATVYEARVMESHVSNYSFVSAEGTFVDKENIQIYNSLIRVSDAYGMAYATNTTNTFLSFSSKVPFDFYFMANTPDYKKAAGTAVTGERGAILSFTGSGVYLRIFKYDVELNAYAQQTVTSTNYLDGKEHRLSIMLGTNVIAQGSSFGETNARTDSYALNVSIATDVSTIQEASLLLPIYNLNTEDPDNGVITWFSADGKSDPEPNTGADFFFIPEKRYMGFLLKGTNGTLSIKEIVNF